MKKKRLSVIPVISVLFAMVYITSCSSCNWWNKDGKNQSISKDSMIIVMRNPGVSQEDFNNYIKRNNPSSVQYLCNSCDSSIVLVPRTLVGGSGQVASGGSLPGDGPTGGASLGYWCNNFQIKFDIPKDQSKVSYQTKGVSVDYSSTDTITVAVLDTGVDSAMLALQRVLFQSNKTSCLGSSPSIGEAANNGWNFIEENANISDDFQKPHGHGSNVAQLIVEQAQMLHTSPVKILPVKVLDENGKGNLFDLMCGMAYAVERGAKIINASLGFYVCEKTDDASHVFKQFIKDNLLSKNVLLLAAAGNVESDPGCGNVRDLTRTHFYPGSFSEDSDMKNIITVTTIGKKEVQVSDMQNYSDAVVDIGVLGDQAPPDSFRFKNPRVVSPDDYIAGSSYATPIATGAIAACLSQVMSGGSIDKDAIIQFLIDHKKVEIDVQFEQRHEVKKGRKLYRNQKFSE